MFLVPISKRICSLGCILLICVAYSASQNLTKDHQDAIEMFNKLVKWPLSPLGRFASDIVDLVMTNSSKALNETLKRGGKSQLGFLKHAVTQNLSNQLGLTLCVVIGLLICLLLLFLPCCIGLFRSRQRRTLENSVSEKRIDVRSKSFCLFEIFIICIAVALLGGAIVIIGSIRSYFTLQVPFGFANFTVQATFQLKLKLLVNHQNRLNDVSRSAFDVIMLLNNVNEDISSDFMERLQNMLRPVLSIASSVKWELVKVIQLLESQGELLNKLISETMTDTNSQIDRFTSSVKALKNSLGSTNVLDPLMNIPKLKISNDSVSGYLAHIPKLREVSKVKIETGLHEISTKLKHIVIQIQYDPSDLGEKLKHAAFTVQKKLDVSTEKYISHIDEYVKDESRDPLLEEIGKAQTESMTLAFIFNLVILVVVVVTLVFAIGLVLAFHGGVCGTSCFRIVRERNRKVFLRSSLSHHSGGAILFFCYFMSIFLWVCWLGCVLLFFMTSFPLTCCRAMKDYSILDMTFDSLELRTTPGWYSLLTSDSFNMTLKETVIQCQMDDSFVPTLPDPLVDTKDGAQIKSTLNFTELIANFSTEISKLKPDNFTGFEVSQFELDDLLADIDVSPPFKTLNTFLTDLTELNVTETLDKIKKDSKGGNVTKLVDTAQRVYNSIVADVSTALANNETFLSKIKSANLTVRTVVKHVKYLNWTTDALYSNLVNGSVDLFDTALNVTINKLIDNIFLEMQLAALAYRKSMSLCGVINSFYEKATAILCNVVLYPIACCWFGFFLLDVFIFIAIVLAVKSARSFRFLPDVFQEERPVGGVKPEDLPTRSASPVSSGLKDYEDEVDDEENQEADDKDKEDSKDQKDSKDKEDSKDQKDSNSKKDSKDKKDSKKQKSPEKD